MNNPSVQLLHALDRLSVNSDFQMVTAFVEQEEKAAIQQLLDGANPIMVHKSQGYVQALRDFLQLATTAKEALSALG